MLSSSSRWSSSSLTSSLSSSELPCSSCSSGGELNGLLLAGEIILVSCSGISTLSVSIGCLGCICGLTPLLLDDSGRTTTAASLQISSKRDWRGCRTIEMGLRGRTGSGSAMWVVGGSGVWPGSGGTGGTASEGSDDERDTGAGEAVTKGSGTRDFSRCGTGICSWASGEGSRVTVS